MCESKISIARYSASVRHVILVTLVSQTIDLRVCGAGVPNFGGVSVMNANKRLKVIAGLILYAGSLGVLAMLSEDASSYGNANNSLAKKWTNTVTSNDVYKAQQDKHVVNVSSSLPNDYSMVQSGKRQPGTVGAREVL
jgi:hypothetical protein